MSQPIWKQVLRPGTYNVGGRVFTFTDADVKQAEQHGKAMIREGLRVPFAWDHDANAYPMMSKGAWLSRGYFGEAVDYRMKDGSLFAKVQIDDPKDAEQFAKVKQVSPGLGKNFTDEKSRTFPGWSVLHVAATPRPIQREIDKQSYAELSLPTGVSAESTVCMGYSQESEPTPTGSAAMDDELVSLLASCGVNVGDGVKDVEDLKGRLKAIAANKTDSDPDVEPEAETEPDDDDPNKLVYPDGSETNPATSGNVMMSQGESKAAAKLIAAEKRQLNARIADMVSKGLDPKHGRKLQTELEKADLSFEDDGNLVQVPVIIKIETAAELMATNGWKPTGGVNLSHQTKPVGDPEEMLAQDSEENIAAATEFALNRKLPGKK